MTWWGASLSVEGEGRKSWGGHARYVGDFLQGGHLSLAPGLPLSCGWLFLFLQEAHRNWAWGACVRDTERVCHRMMPETTSLGWSPSSAPWVHLREHRHHHCHRHLHPTFQLRPGTEQ